MTESGVGRTDPAVVQGAAPVLPRAAPSPDGTLPAWLWLAAAACLIVTVAVIAVDLHRSHRVRAAYRDERELMRVAQEFVDGASVVVDGCAGARRADGADCDRALARLSSLRRSFDAALDAAPRDAWAGEVGEYVRALEVELRRSGVTRGAQPGPASQRVLLAAAANAVAEMNHRIAERQWSEMNRGLGDHWRRLAALGGLIVLAAAALLALPSAQRRQLRHRVGAASDDDALFLVGPRGDALAGNAAAAHLARGGAPAAPGPDEQGSADVAARVLDAVGAAVRDDAAGGRHRRHLQLLAPGGRALYFDISVVRVPELSPWRAPVGLVRVRDRSSGQRRLDEIGDQIDEILRLVARLPVGIVRVAPDGALLASNRTALRLLGVTEAGLARRFSDNPAAVLGAPHEQRFGAAWSRALRGQACELEALPVVAPDGSTAHLSMYLNPLRRASDSVDSVVWVLVDVSHLRREHERKVAYLLQHRGALIGEIHHRIKNHLQGVLALVDGQIASLPGSAEVRSRVSTQMRSIAVLYGLAGEGASGAISLVPLLRAIVDEIRGVRGRDIEVSIDGGPDDAVRVAPGDGASIALALSELVTNAVKHSGDARAPVRVRCTVAADGGSAIVEISNPGGTDLRWQTEPALREGCGLSLVDALLPDSGAALEFGSTAGRVTATLKLTAPALCVEPRAAAAMPSDTGLGVEGAPFG